MIPPWDDVAMDARPSANVSRRPPRAPRARRGRRNVPECRRVAPGAPRSWPRFWNRSATCGRRWNCPARAKEAPTMPTLSDVSLGIDERGPPT